MSYLGRFNDGQTAESREVLASFHEEGLYIYVDRNELPLLWSYPGVTVVDGPESGILVRLRHSEAGDALFSIEDQLFASELYRRLPKLAPGDQRVRRWFSGLIAAVICIAGFAALGWIGLPLIAAFLADRVPIEWERRLKDAIYEPILRDLAGAENGPVPRRCAEPAGLDALNRLTRKLASVTDQGYSFDVMVLDLKINNAFALPGGHILLTRGLIEFAGNGNEFAAVLAHEMAHVLHRHGLRHMIEGYGLRLAANFVFGSGVTVDLLGPLATFTLTAAYSREAEREADATGITILREARLASDGLTRYLDRLTRTESSSTQVPQILSSHPSNEERIRDARLIQSEGAPALSESDFRSLKAICGAPRTPAKPPVSGARPRA